MRTTTRFTATILLTGLAAMTVSVAQLQAGTPLTCFPFQIGNAASLPWNSSADARNWNAPRSDYDTRRLADDTTSLLDQKTPVIVRMETIRRAALYGRKDPAAAAELLARLKTRALGSKEGRTNALYLFDYGYLIETYKQASLLQGEKKGVSAGSENGFAYVLEALSLRGNDSEMEFAAALIASWPKKEQYQEHFQNAIAGASRDQLLAANLDGRLR